jgi:hypothetical protein
MYRYCPMAYEIFASLQDCFGTERVTAKEDAVFGFIFVVTQYGVTYYKRCVCA